MGQCRLLLMHDTSLLIENLYDASLMIVTNLKSDCAKNLSFGFVLSN